MKNSRLLLLMLLAFVGLVTVRCTKNNDVKPDAASNTNSNRSARLDGTCGTETTCTLWAGQTIDAGTLTIENDNTNLYVTYNTTGTFGTLHLWVGTNFELMPQAAQGQPIPGQFPYKYESNGGTSHTFTIPLSEIPFYDGKCGVNSKTPILVVAHAEVTINGKGETAFGGCVPVNVKEPGRWWYYASYTVQCCGETPPPPTGKLGTAFAYGTHVFTTDPKSNPLGLPSLRLTKNRWGWANFINDGTYTRDLWVGAGLNNTNKALKVGTVTITKSGDQVTVAYNLIDGYLLEEAHIYVSDAKPTTLAPGQYGSTAYFDPMTNTYSKTFTITDAAGDGIWVIAHGVVWGAGVVNVM